MKYSELISQMTLEEKASLMSGENFWNTKEIKRLSVPSMMLTDGPHGLRKQGGKADHLGLNKSMPATCFPTASTLANSWDVELLEKTGMHLGKEAAMEDVSVLLGPGLNIKRNPLCGRNFEYFSEDPFLSGKLASAMVKGIQSEGVSACPKHFAVNSQESMRMVIDEVVDERALREIYLEGFRYTIEEAGAKTIMTAYNKLNGTYTNENSHILQKILIGEWNYKGLIVTDWGGENDRVDGLIAGNGLEMPSTSGVTDQEIIQEIKDGKIKESLLDERVNTYLELLYDTLPAKKKEKSLSYSNQHEAAKIAAKESIILLKNEENILPLNEKIKIAIIGDFAKNPRYQGAGSSLINPKQLDNALAALQSSRLNVIGYEKGFKRFGGKSKNLENKAISLVKKADVVLLFIGLDEGSESEGVDRTHMRLPENQIQVLSAICNICDKVVVVLSGGAPIEMPWLNDVAALVHGYLGGEGGGSAVVDILCGDYNPSGKLAESYPISYNDVSSAPWFPGKQLTAEHRESIYIGYRYYDTIKKQVLFPFGFGLSYTSFLYSNLTVTENKVKFTLKNTGNVAGAEVVQIYISKNISEVFRPKKELKGFDKIFLEAGGEKEVIIELDNYAFSYYNTALNRWAVERGEYTVLVGASSRDIRLEYVVQKDGEQLPNPYDKKILKNYYTGQILNISDNEFENLIGYTLPQSNWDKTKPLDRHSTLWQGKYKKGFARFLHNLILFISKMCFILRKPIAGNNVMFAMNLPFRSMSRLTGGVLNDEMVDGLLLMVNRHFFKGLGSFIKSAFCKKKKQKNI